MANRIPDEVEDVIVELRKELTNRGVDAGPATIQFHLPGRLPSGAVVPAESGIWRALKRRGFIVDDPSKAPKNTSRSFAAERANECWQIDDTNWQLADETPVKIIDVLDDCTRVCAAARVVATCTGAEAFNAIAEGAAEWGWPERVLSDNARAFRQKLANALRELGIAMGHSRPYHPQTCGKVERFHQTLKLFLAAQPPAKTIAELQAQVDEFVDYYNNTRPHRSLGRRTPAAVWNETPKSGPADHPLCAGTTVTTNIVSRNGQINPRKGLSISLGAAHIAKHATTVITANNAHVFIDGVLVRALTINPTRRSQPLYDRPGRPPQPTA
ncbi:MAG: transposase family protein [Mycobacteriaceae bacterium]|nr:transposase family protein [Mycobacteriaceae bacterium]